MDVVVIINEMDEAESMESETLSTQPRRKCEVCNETEAKYRCPKCDIRTCSLPCVQQHKEDSYCDGIQDRTAYVSLSKYNTLNLLSDYRLLEETARCVNNAMRYPLKRAKYGLPMSRKIPYWQYRMVTECRRRGTCLMISPQNFQRRKINTTFFATKTKEMFWQIEWIFSQADVKYTTEKVSENTTLGEALEPYLTPELCTPEVRQHLCFYHSAGFGNIIPLMKVERIRSKEPKYVELDFSETIRSNLTGKLVIEFPTIHLVLQHHKQCYELLESVKEKPKEELEEGELETTDDESRKDIFDEHYCSKEQMQCLGPYFNHVNPNDAFVHLSDSDGVT